MKKIVLAFCLFSSVIAKSQNKKLDLELGVRWRVTPIILDKIPFVSISNIPFLIDVDSHLSGFSFITGIKSTSKNNKNVIGYRANIRYDEFLSSHERGTIGPGQFFSRLMLDHSFYYTHKLFKIKKADVHLGFGISINNINTGFSYSSASRNNIGTFDTAFQNSNLEYQAMDFPIVFEFEKATLSLTTSITMGTKFYTYNYADLLLLNFSYVRKLDIRKKTSSLKK